MGHPLFAPAGYWLCAFVACASIPDSPPPQRDSRASTIRVGGARLSVDLDGRRDVPREVRAWVRRAGEITAEYYGGDFPVSVLRVKLRRRALGNIGWGAHYFGRRVEVSFGRGTTKDEYARDWVLLHEMLHTGFPSLARKHRWMREGLSTYLETALRARAGILTEEEVWERWLDRMPNGLPRARDAGLDATRTWGAVYWGGTLFWHRLEVELLRRSQNRISIRDILKAAVARGGDARRRWPMQRVLQLAEEVTGGDEMRRLYQEMGLKPWTFDLDEYWAALGISRGSNGVRFDSQAPLAGVRQAMNRTVDVQLTPLR